MTSIILLFVLAFTLISVVGGMGGAIMSLTLYKGPRQRRLLTRPSTRLILGLLTSFILGIPLILLPSFLERLGLSAFLMNPIEFITTIVFVNIGTYGGYTIGIKVFERWVNG